MIADALHIARKDLRQHRAWLAGYLAVVIIRALLIGSGIDTAFRAQAPLVSLGMAYVVLSVLHVALFVTLAVQLVQGDRLVGTTAFWMTRPVSRGALLASKLAGAVGLLVVVPVVVDAVVILVSGLSGLDAVGAVAEGVAVRLAVLLPIMTLAAVTGDLAVFVVVAIATLFGTFTLLVAMEALKLVTPKLNNVGESLLVVAILTVAFGSLAALACQVFSRRTRQSAAIIVATVALTLLAVGRVQTPFVSPPRTLEPGWVNPARVSVTLTPFAPNRLPGVLHALRPWQLRSTYNITAATTNVALGLDGVATTILLADGSKVEYHGTFNPYRHVRSLGPTLARKGMVEQLLGGVRLVDAVEGDPETIAVRPTEQVATMTEEDYRSYSERGGRVEAEVTVGALAYEACKPLPLEGGARGRCGNRQILVLSADCRGGRCRVSLRDAMAVFDIDLRRLSGVHYVLVNRAKGQGLVVGERDYFGRLVGERDYFGRFPVFGRATFLLLAEHLAVTRRDLIFEPPKEMPDMLGPEWLKEAVIVPLQIRDIGEFTVRADVR